MLNKESLAWLNKYIPQAHGVVIPNAVNIPLVRNSPYINPLEYISKNKKLLLAVGRLDQQKQFNILIDNFFKLHNDYKDWNLYILGEGQERDSLLYQIRKLNLANRVFLMGKVGNISDWYLRADLFVMTSRFEGFPNSLIESMAHGCPAVSFDCDTGPRDIIRQNIDGFLIPNGNTKELVRALKLLMSDKKLRRQMSKRAEEVRERYSNEKILPMWEAIFLHI
jgi:glycosyltransferase involved in cell wall biosynthesis